MRGPRRSWHHVHVFLLVFGPSGGTRPSRALPELVWPLPLPLSQSPSIMEAGPMRYTVEIAACSGSTRLSSDSLLAPRVAGYGMRSVVGRLSWPDGSRSSHRQICHAAMLPCMLPLLAAPVNSDHHHLPVERCHVHQTDPTASLGFAEGQRHRGQVPGARCQMPGCRSSINRYNRYSRTTCPRQ